MYLWKKFPWTEKPVTHLLIELAALIVYPIAVVWLGIQPGIVGIPHEERIVSIMSVIMITLLISVFIDDNKYIHIENKLQKENQT